MNKLLLVLLLVAVVALAAWAFNQGKDDGFTTVGVDEFERTIADTAGVQLLDVRAQDEYNEGHLPGAYLINMRDSNFLEQVEAQLVKEKTIAIYCRSGRRSASAASKLVKAGYTVINLDGGILAWQQQGKTVMK
ncbi:MAG: rhodanese-like domain-containing protein [Muribaculaceae bacterium]|nr:rhodanese-like domain-containing protein [Muribaculaceae bacterium]